MEIRFLTSGLACWNRKVKRAERASEPAVRSSSFIVDDQLQAPATHTRRGLHPLSGAVCSQRDSPVGSPDGSRLAAQMAV